MLSHKSKMYKSNISASEANSGHRLVKWETQRTLGIGSPDDELVAGLTGALVCTVLITIALQHTQLKGGEDHTIIRCHKQPKLFLGMTLFQVAQYISPGQAGIPSWMSGR